MNRPVHFELTRREQQVLQDLLHGRSTREISVRYGIGHQTVKNYVTVIYEKLGVTGRHQLASVATCPVAAPAPSRPDA